MYLSKINLLFFRMHLEWISIAGFAFNSAKLWISTIDIHLKTQNIQTAQKLLDIVQYLPIKDLKSITLLAKNKELLAEYPTYKIPSSIPTALQSLIKRREQFETQNSSQIKTIQNINELEKFYENYLNECKFYINEDKRTSPSQKELLREFGIDPIFYIYQDGFQIFSKFTNHMKFALKFLDLVAERIFMFIGTNFFPEETKEFLKPFWISHLRSLIQRLSEFACFPNSSDIQLEIASQTLKIIEFLEKLLKKQSNWFSSGVVAQLLNYLSNIYTFPIIPMLTTKMVQLTTAESFEHIQNIRSYFENITNYYQTILNNKNNLPSSDIIKQATELWNSWIALEIRLNQFHQVMKCFENALNQPEVCSIFIFLFSLFRFIYICVTVIERYSYLETLY